MGASGEALLLHGSFKQTLGSAPSSQCARICGLSFAHWHRGGRRICGSADAAVRARPSHEREFPMSLPLLLRLAVLCTPRREPRLWMSMRSSKGPEILAT